MENHISHLAVGVELGDKLEDSRRRYRIVRYIKSGGFGNTYEAEDRKFLNRRVAIKELYIAEWCNRGEDSVSVAISVESNQKVFDKLKEQFIKEAIKLNGFIKDGIVRVIDVFESNGTAYYAMDYIDGESLSNRLKSINGKPISETQVCNYLDQILDALEYVHGKGVLHLDIKPANIMADKEGKVTLIDFGASKQYKEIDGKSLSTSSNIAYTRGFAPTEQIEGEIDKMGTHTDMYALGATLYNLLTGKLPPSISDIEDGYLLDKPEQVSDNLWNVVKKCLIPNRNKRIKTVAEFRSVLAMQPEGDGGGATGGDDSGDGGTTLRDKMKKPSWSTWLKQRQGNIVKLLGGILIAGLVAFGINRCDGFGGAPIDPDSAAVADSAVAISDSISVIEIPEEVETDSETALLAEQQRQQEAEEARRRQSQGGISTSKEVDLGLSVNWAGWNVGASSPEGYGSFFAWGETSPKNGKYVESTYRYHNGSSYINIGSNISGTQYDAARANWGGSWRMPTEAECEELVNRCKWKWTTYNGVNGMKVTGPNGNSIFLPAAGYQEASLMYRDLIGYYWSSNLCSYYNGNACDLSLSRKFGPGIGDGGRLHGNSVRPVKAR